MSKKFIEVSNSWCLGEHTPVDGREIFLEKKEYTNYIELENGVWLKSYGDGRYIDEDTDEYYAAVFFNEYDDEDDEFSQGDLIGYCKV